jgi:hypothetical protein
LDVSDMLSQSVAYQQPFGLGLWVPLQNVLHIRWGTYTVTRVCLNYCIESPSFYYSIFLNSSPLCAVIGISHSAATTIAQTITIRPGPREHASGRNTPLDPT